MKKTAIRSLLSLALLPIMACGQTPVSNHSSSPAKAASSVKNQSDVGGDLATKLTKKLEKTYEGQEIKVQSVRKTPVNGLYEIVVTGNQVIYVDGDANYMLVGDLIDINTRKSLTDERTADLNKIDYSKLPFDKAIKEVRGNGKLKIAVFSDPDCPFCKRLEHEFAQMTDITIYNFMMPITSLHPDANRKAEILWCQSNRTQAWITWMREGKFPASAKDCSNPVAETTALGAQLGFTGTPTLVFPNGHTQSGFSPLPALQKIIEDNQK